MVIGCGFGPRRDCGPELHLPDEVAAKLRFTRRAGHQDERGSPLVDGISSLGVRATGRDMQERRC